jgi:CO dehydrogenase maturation factor
MNKTKTVIIALSGKGGVGKTSLAAAFVKALVVAHPGKKILAIDADPAVGLSTALGVEVKVTLDEIRQDIVKNVKEGDKAAAIELLKQAQYRVYEALVNQNGFSFIAIGRPEAAGCYCRINDYLKDVISLLANQFDYVVIDGEAGVEQINRRVMEKVTHLVLVTDTSKKGTQVIHTIKEVADGLVMYEKVGVIINRCNSEEIANLVSIGNLPLLATISDDASLAKFDLLGQSVFTLPDATPLMKGAREALSSWNLLEE